jgi:Zn finger protein HypA/HybF involved in hydrogenase expression
MSSEENAFKLPESVNHKCWKCKERRDYKPTSFTDANNKSTKMARGNCPVCNAGMSRIVSTKAPKPVVTVDAGGIVLEKETPTGEPSA